MELRHLRYFEAVARHEHLSRAAVELMISQPALTKQLRDLEEELEGGPLFERVGRRKRLTETGRALLRHTQTILGHVQAARAEMRERGELHSGRVSIGAPPTVSERVLPGILRDFHRSYPDIELRVHEGSTSLLMGLLERSEIELAVVTLPVKGGLALETIELFSEPLVLIAEVGHWIERHATVDVADLRDEPFLLYSPGGYVREATLTACREAGFVPQIALDSGSMELLLRMAAAGLGVAVIPRLAVEGDPRLVWRPLRHQNRVRTMAIVSRAGRTLSLAAQRMRDQLTDVLGRLGDAG